MPEEPKRPKKFKTALIVVAVVAIVFGVCLVDVVSNKFIWGMNGDNSSWNTWEFQITGEVIVVILTLLAVYYHSNDK
jgi:uncharacterized membrane-anchored protein